MDELSAELKARREALSLTPDDIHKQTRINVEFIEALEAGQYDVLPETYIRLFLKKYAQELGLDPDTVLSRYIAQKRLDSEALRPLPSRQTSSMGPALAIAGVLALLVGVGIWALREPPPENTPEVFLSSTTPAKPASPAESQIRQEASPTLPEPTPADPSETITQAPQTQERETPNTTISETSEAQNTSATKPDEPANPPSQNRDQILEAYSLSPPFAPTLSDSLLTLTGLVLEATRIEISADGESLFSGALSPGNRRTWQARDRFLVQIEKGAAISLFLQNHELKPLGNPNRKLRVFINRSSVWIEELAPARSRPDTVVDL